MNNLSVFPNKPAIKDEAGAWVVRLDSGELSVDEIQQLRSWMQRSDFHREYLLKLAANWDAMGMLQELGEIFPLPEKEETLSGQSGWANWPARMRRYFQFPAAATLSGLAILAVVTAAFLANGLWFAGMPSEYVTAIGERQSYTLADGSVISLNTNTRIQVDFDDARRAITLVQGEASFDVAKNPERPFMVFAGTGLVWAVGTAFNVRYEAGRVDVIVTEGQVKVFSDTQATQSVVPSLEAIVPPAETSAFVAADLSSLVQADQAQREALLGAGETLRYAQVIESLQTLAQEDSIRLLAWQEGSLVFKGETLEQAVVEISRYTDKELIIADAALRTLRVGGHYKTDDIDALLASLGQGLGISVAYAANNRVLLSATHN